MADSGGGGAAAAEAAARRGSGSPEEEAALEALLLLGPPRRRHRCSALSPRKRTTSQSKTEPPLLRTSKRTIYTAGRPPWYNEAGTPFKEAFVIGLCGGSASGKTTVANKIIEALDVPWVVLLSMDSFYKVLNKEQQQQAAQNEYNFDHPDAFDFDLLISVLRKLKEGKSVKVPVYDFTTHSRRKEWKTVYGANVIVFEGILAFANKELLQLLDMKVFVDTDSDIRLVRRLKRDIVARGRDVVGVLKQYSKFVKPAFEQYIEPTVQAADIVVPRGGENFVALDLIVQHVHSQLEKREITVRYDGSPQGAERDPLLSPLPLLFPATQLAGHWESSWGRGGDGAAGLFWSTGGGGGSLPGWLGRSTRRVGAGRLHAAVVPWAKLVSWPDTFQMLSAGQGLALSADWAALPACLPSLGQGSLHWVSKLLLGGRRPARQSLLLPSPRGRGAGLPAAGTVPAGAPPSGVQKGGLWGGFSAAGGEQCDLGVPAIPPALVCLWQAVAPSLPLLMPSVCLSVCLSSVRAEPWRLHQRELRWQTATLASAHQGQPLPKTLSVLQSTPQVRGMHTIIRNKETSRDEFIFYSKRLMRLLIEHALSFLPLKPVTVETPQGTVYEGKRFHRQRITGVSILRAGETMEQALTAVCKDIRLGKILIQTNHDTGEPELHYLRLPKEISEDYVILMDSTVSTGAAAMMAVRVLLDHDVQEDKIFLLSLLMAEMGVHSVAYAFPRVHIITTAVDKRVNEDFHIIPGIGNFGDRYFGTDGSVSWPESDSLDC